MMPAFRIVVSGGVQGVGFRYWAVRQATRLGISGHVRNLLDGSVEIVASGSEEAVGEMVRLCGRGPAQAIVGSVESSPCPDPGAAGFTVLRDGLVSAPGGSATS